MKTFLILLLSSLSLVAQTGLRSPAFVGQLRPSAGIITLYTEGFEGTGYEVATTETAAGVDEDNATSPPQGSQNLSVARVASGIYAYPTAGWGPQAVITMEGWFRVDTVGAANQIIQIDASANSTARGFIFVTAAAAVQIYGTGGGSVSATTTDTVTINTWYKFQAKWNKTTAAYSIEFNTGGTFNGSGTDYASNTNGDTGVTVGGMSYYSSVNNYTTLFDGMSVLSP